MVAAAYEGPQICLGFTAGATLTSYQYHLVKLSADNTVDICSSADDVPIGVLLNAPASGANADVCIAGVTKILAGGALTYGNAISSGDDGHADAVSMGNVANGNAIGRVIAGSGAEGDLCTVFICCISNRSA